MEFLDQPRRRYGKELAALTSIAALTGENKFSNAISVRHIAAFFEDPGKEVIDVHQGQRYAGATIEASSLLISVERRPHAGQVHAAKALNEEKVPRQICLNGDTGPR